MDRLQVEETGTGRLRILMVNYEYPPLGGGGGVAMEAIARELATRHQVHVLTSGARGLPAEERSQNGDLTVFRSRVVSRSSSAKSVASIPSMLAFYPSGIRRGRKLAAQHDYDVVNTWFAVPSGPIGSHIARHGKIPHVLTIIGGDIYDPSKWYSPHRNPILGGVVRRVLRGADRHTAISTDIAARARDQFDFQRPIDVISLGIQPPEFRARPREELGLRNDRKYLVSVGRLVRRKNYANLLRALATLDHEDTDLLLIGDGPELETLKSLATELGVLDRVQFRGFVDEETKFQLLAASDAFVLTSLHEGFGLVYLEAMHCGLPVIASSGGGQEDFLVDQKTGFVVPPEDLVALRTAIDRIAGDDELRESFCASNRRLVKDYYVSRTAQRYETLLAEACKRPTRSEVHGGVECVS